MPGQIGAAQPSPVTTQTHPPAPRTVVRCLLEPAHGGGVVLLHALPIGVDVPQVRHGS